MSDWTDPTPKENRHQKSSRSEMSILEVIVDFQVPLRECYKRSGKIAPVPMSISWNVQSKPTSYGMVLTLGIIRVINWVNDCKCSN